MCMYDEVKNNFIIKSFLSAWTHIETCIGLYRKQKRLLIIMIINLFVAGRGYDPRTSGLWIRRSNQLSYPAVHVTFVLESGCKGMKKISYSQILSRFFNGYSIKSFIFAPDNRNKRLYNMLLFCVITAFLGLWYYWRVYLLVCW